MIETGRPVEQMDASPHGSYWCVHHRTSNGDDVGTFHSKESADLFADAPRVLAERDRLREALDGLLAVVGNRLCGGTGRARIKIARAALQETETPDVSL